MKKKATNKIINTSLNLIKPEDLNFHARQIFLMDNIDKVSTHQIIEKIVALNTISKDKIVMRITSPGGSVAFGLAIIDIIRVSPSPIITYILGRVCSMASLISITGNLRVMGKHATMLFHPMSGGIDNDYYEYQKDRFGAAQITNKICLNIIKKYTNLNKTQLDKIKNGELWLTAKQALKYGVVDKII